MSKPDPHYRINLTGLRAGFGVQGGHMFTPVRREKQISTRKADGRR